MREEKGDVGGCAGGDRRTIRDRGGRLPTRPLRVHWDDPESEVRKSRHRVGTRKESFGGGTLMAVHGVPTVPGAL